MIFQRNFITNIKAVYGDSGIAWIQNLPSQIAQLCAFWNCKLIDIVPNLTFNFVGIVEISGRPPHRAILKMAPPGGSISSEVKWLKKFKNSVPDVITVAEATGHGGAFLMEQCLPGTSLKAIQDGFNDDQITLILSNIIKNLQSHTQYDSSFKHLSELIPDLQSLTGRADPYLFQKSVSLFTDLTNDRSNDILLHGDLHHDNILSHGDTWKVIDPHGYVGDPVSEIGVMIYNPVDAFPKDKPLVTLIERRLRIMGESLQFDLQRMQAWAFCKTMLSSAWNITDFGEKATGQLGIAQAIDQLRL